MVDQCTFRELQSIQRKLDRWELDHLRKHAAQLAALLEAAQAEIKTLKRELDWANDRADMFADLSEVARDYTGTQIGLTKNGQLHVLTEAHA